MRTFVHARKQIFAKRHMQFNNNTEKNKVKKQKNVITQKTKIVSDKIALSRNKRLVVLMSASTKATARVTIATTLRTTSVAAVITTAINYACIHLNNNNKCTTAAITIVTIC